MHRRINVDLESKDQLAFITDIDTFFNFFQFLKMKIEY